MKNEPISMITIASEQLIPQLEAAAHFFDNRQKGCKLHVIYTNDLYRSREPAELLCNLLKTKFQNLETRLAKRPVNPLPEEVAELAAEIIKSAAPKTSWIINATGGTKLMSTVLIEMAGQKNIRVIYRELSQNKWYEIKRSSTGTLISSDLALEAKPLAAYSVFDILHTQLGAPAGKGFELKFESAPKVDFFTLIDAQIENCGDSEKAFHKLGLPTKSPGFAFEMLIASTIKAFEINDVACNVTFTNKEQGQILQEIDIVINNGHKLLFIDCKLRNAEEEKDNKVEGITSQIRQAAETRRKFGGLGAEMMLLRPNRTFSEAEKELCLLHNLKFIEHEQISELLPRLYSFCTGKGANFMNKQLLSVQSKIEAENHKGNMVFFKPFRPVIKRESEGKATEFNLDFRHKKLGKIDFIMSLNSLLDHEMNYSGKKWTLLNFGNFFLLNAFFDNEQCLKISRDNIFSEKNLPIKILFCYGKNRRSALFCLNDAELQSLEQLIAFFQKNRQNHILIPEEYSYKTHKPTENKTQKKSPFTHRITENPLIRKTNM